MYSKLAFSAVLLTASLASAHISMVTTPAQADSTTKLTFGVGHGCEDANGHYDTAKIRIEIPAGFTSVRPLALPGFGKPTVIRTGTTVTAVEWTKATADILDDDDSYYEPTIRARTPNAPFTKVTFTIVQTCRAGNADITTTWTGPDEPSNDTPGPTLFIGPKRTNPTGWNKITVATGVNVTVATDLAGFFKDARIVWKGASAFSTNSATTAQIGSTSGVTALTTITAGDEIWVRY